MSNVINDLIIDEIVNLEGLKILIVEDNEINRLVAKNTFKRHNCILEEAANGIEAIEKLRSKEFDIILMDIQMPVMDGLLATQYIRNEMGSEIPIIALTANASKDDEMIYRSAGMNDHLSKPFRQDALFEKIRSLCDAQLMKKERVEVSIEQEVLANYSLSNIEEIAAGDQEFIVSIVETFCTNTPNYLRQIAEGIASKDLEKIRFSAHQMKPSIDILMVTEVKETIREIEEIAARDKNREEEIQLIFEKFQHLSKSLIRVIDDLSERFLV
jgi:CheY-like chemotaxis protein/HPt (histidine-containing phosphotransfer) domain-containing protein